MKVSKIIWVSLLALVPLILSGCAADQAAKLTSSGYLSAIEASVAPELSGRVVTINVEEGETVRAGDALFVLDDAFIRAQRDQASAAVSTAEGALEAARANSASAQSQYDLALQGARLQDMQSRQSVWLLPVGDAEQPAWYYQKSEKITALQSLLEQAKTNLDDELSDLQNELEKASSKDFVAVEQRLIEAQYALTSASATLSQAEQLGDDALVNGAQDQLDSAQMELDAARHDFDTILTTTAAESVLEARAQVAVAQATLDTLQDTLLSLQTGDQSLQVAAAKAAAEAARAAVGQAEGGLAQAKAALKLADLQLERTVVTAPVEGTVLSRTIEVGELAAAGGIVMRIAQLDTLELVVYLPEDQYGKVRLGDPVMVAVDSFPGRTFGGEVIYISDEAEFTPRNVQTEQGRKATTYAVKIQISNLDHVLKPGMPADVEFGN